MRLLCGLVPLDCSSTSLPGSLSRRSRICPCIDHAASYLNVFRSRRSSSQSTLTPLLYLLPFPITSLLQMVWLASPSINDSAILHTHLFLPFACAWGLQFAHTVGRMILAHITKSEFPLWDNMWLLSIVGAVDAHLPTLLGRYAKYFAMQAIHEG